ncbi:hypothetical protein F5883DRAFT_693363 [Diaporthe sp. PMI_573]|nr:hypothetical protein F5883DRAFT_693363 [Diaporthaceae sp. PMI_573]
MDSVVSCWDVSLYSQSVSAEGVGIPHLPEKPPQCVSSTATRARSYFTAQTHEREPSSRLGLGHPHARLLPCPVINSLNRCARDNLGSWAGHHLGSTLGFQLSTKILHVFFEGILPVLGSGHRGGQCGVFRHQVAVAIGHHGSRELITRSRLALPLGRRLGDLGELYRHIRNALMKFLSFHHAHRRVNNPLASLAHDFVELVRIHGFLLRIHGFLLMILLDALHLWEFFPIDILCAELKMIELRANIASAMGVLGHIAKQVQVFSIRPIDEKLCAQDGGVAAVLGVLLDRTIWRKVGQPGLNLCHAGDNPMSLVFGALINR